MTECIYWIRRRPSASASLPSEPMWGMSCGALPLPSPYARLRIVHLECSSTPEAATNMDVETPEAQQAPAHTTARVVAPIESEENSRSSDWRGSRGRCRLVVNVATHIDGDCWIRLEDDGSFQIMSLDDKYFAQLNRSGREELGYWTETPSSTHAHTALGIMTRNGPCWSNVEAEICAWAD